MPKIKIGINLLFMKPGVLTGPGVYAQRLTNALLDEGTYEWLIFCRQGLELPRQWEAKAELRRIAIGPSQVTRVLYEQLVFPLHCRRKGVDLLFSPGFVSPLWGIRHKVAAIPDMYYEVIPHALPAMQRRYWKLFVPLTARRCDRIIAISQSTANDISKYIPNARAKITVTHLASAVEDPNAPGVPVSGVEPGYVLYVANIVASKNPRAVARAASALALQGKPLRFVHVGADNDSLLRQALAEFDVNSNFRQVGRVSAAQLRWLYRNALCAIVPSIYEGFGMPALEAQQYGAPLVSSNAGSLTEVAGDGALYFEPQDADKLAELICTISENPDLREALIARGLDNSLRFTWQRTAQKTLEVFAHVSSSA